MSLDLIPNGGRYPHGPAFYDISKIRARLERHEDTVIIHIDDDRYPDPHERFTVSVRDLLKELLGSSTETRLG